MKIGQCKVKKIILYHHMFTMSIAIKGTSAMDAQMCTVLAQKSVQETKKNI